MRKGVAADDGTIGGEGKGSDVSDASWLPEPPPATDLVAHRLRTQDEELHTLRNALAELKLAARAAFARAAFALAPYVPQRPSHELKSSLS